MNWIVYTILHKLLLKEVSHWADLPVEFVLIGLDGCGTTSLRRNLAKHPAARIDGLCSTARRRFVKGSEAEADVGRSIQDAVDTVVF